jgi:hypothetical protein
MLNYYSKIFWRNTHCNVLSNLNVTQIQSVCRRLKSGLSFLYFIQFGPCQEIRETNTFMNNSQRWSICRSRRWCVWSCACVCVCVFFFRCLELFYFSKSEARIKIFKFWFWLLRLVVLMVITTVSRFYLRSESITTIIIIMFSGRISVQSCRYKYKDLSLHSTFIVIFREL